MANSAPDRDKETSSRVNIGGVKGGIHGSVIAGRDVERTRIGQTIVNVFRGTTPKSVEQRNRQAILRRTRSFWIEGVLEKSLHGLAILELNMVDRPEAVDNPLNFSFVTADRSTQQEHLPAGTEFLDRFEQTGRALLILGDPGSGKTMTLLKLARDTLAQADQDPTRPVPVIFNLSSWSQSAKPLADWLVDELKIKYRIPSKISRRWIEKRELLLLLDGLDEVKQEYREGCVRALNEFSQNYGLKNIVVCSRTTSYEDLRGHLNLQGAVVLQPLSDAQVDEYLAKAGAELAAVRTLLQEDKILQELTRSPLTLSIITLAYRGKTVAELRGFGSIEARRSHLFDTYIQRMFNRLVRTRQPDYPERRTIEWLSWLAQHMNEQAQSIFLIERLQPGWLSTGQQQWLYLISSRLGVGSLIGLVLGIIGLSIGLLELGVGGDPLTALLGGLLFGLAGFGVALVGGIAAGLVDGLRLKFRRKEAESQATRRWLAIATNLLFWGVGNFIFAAFSFGLLAMLTIWLVAGVSPDIDSLTNGLVDGLLFGIFSGLSFGLIFGLRGAGSSIDEDVVAVELLSWSWFASLRGVIFGFVGGLLAGMIGGTVMALLIEPTLRQAYGLGFDLLALLIFTLSLAGLGGIICGPGGALIGWLFGGLRASIIESKTNADSGVWLFARNAILAGVVFGLGGGIAGGLVFSLIFGLLGWSANALPGLVLGLLLGAGFGIASGLTFGLVGGLRYGGLAFIQHITLRFFLWRSGHIPWRYGRFLDYAVDYVFLRRVGGGYIFIHRLLREHFAGLKLKQGK